MDYAQLIKVYAGASDGNPNTKYSPPICCGARKEPVRGWPDADHISTSFVERANLTMRMGMRRFTRLTNGFSRRSRTTATRSVCTSCFTIFAGRTSRCARARFAGLRPWAAGVADHVWTIAELVALLPERAGRFQKIGQAAE